MEMLGIGFGLVCSGAVVGFVTASFFAAAKMADMQRQARSVINRLEYRVESYKLVLARIRGFQQHGIKQPNGEIKYNLQNAKGRFVKAFLPEL